MNKYNVSICPRITKKKLLAIHQKNVFSEGDVEEINAFLSSRNERSQPYCRYYDRKRTRNMLEDGDKNEKNNIPG